MPAVAEAVAAAIPDRDLVIRGERRYSYAQLVERSNWLAGYVHCADLGAIPTERSALANHEVGQDHLGLYVYNGNEYIEGMIGSYLARVAPFNVNYRYVEEELQYLLTDAGARALVYHATFAPVLARVLPVLPKLRVLLQVADESGNDLLPGAVDYEAALAQFAPSSRRWSSRPTTSTSSTPAAPPACPRVCCGASTTSSCAAMGGRTYGTWELVESYDHLSCRGACHPGHPAADVHPAAHARRRAVGVLLLHDHGCHHGLPRPTPARSTPSTCGTPWSASG